MSLGAHIFMIPFIQPAESSLNEVPTAVSSSDEMSVSSDEASFDEVRADICVSSFVLINYSSKTYL